MKNIFRTQKERSFGFFVDNEKHKESIFAIEKLHLLLDIYNILLYIISQESI